MTGSRTETTESPDAVSIDPVLLPETGRGGRARQRRRRRRQRRLKLLAVTVVVAVLAGAVAFLVGSGDETTGGQRAEAPGRATPPAAAPPVLLALQEPSGRASSLTVLAPAAGGGGSVVLIPPGTMTEVVSLGLEPVGRSLELGGPARLQATVENLLGVGLASVVALDAGGLAALLEPLGPVTVQVPERVEQVGPTGRVEVLWEAGPATIAPGDADRFLEAKGRGTDLARLARHQAFLDAWLDAVRARPDAAPTQPPALAQAFDA
ncbi:MAG: LCP family protein, partial [Actinomycetota bacterium]|nr:LCP family protein [Actinomycetota bacterium]